MTLQDVQLNIRVNVVGQQQLAALSRGYTNLSKQLNNVGTVIKDKDMMRSPLAQSLDEIEKKFDAVFRAGIRLIQLGMQLKGAGMFGINLLKDAAASWGDYELNIKKAGIALSTTADWQKRLSSTVYDTSRAVGLFDPNEVAQAYYWWGSAAGTVVDSQERLNKVTAAVTKIMLASAAAGGDVEQSIKGVYSILRQYRLGLGDAGDVTEKLYLMTLRTALEFPDLIQAFKYAGPLARALGMDLDEVVKLFGVLGDLGQRGSLPGRGFAMMLQRLLAPTGAALKEIDPVFKKAFGKNFEEAIFPKGQFIGMERYIKMFSTATMNMTPHDRQALLGKFFTQNSTRIMVPLVEAQIRAYRKAQADGLEKYPSVLDEEKYELTGATGSFEEMRERITKSWNAIVGRVQTSVTEMKNIIGQAVATAFGPAIEALDQILQKVSDWMEQNPEAVQFMTTLLGIGSAFLVVAGQAAILLGSLLLLWGGMNIASTILANFKLFGLSLGPLSLVVAAISAGVWAFSTNFLGFRDVVVQAGGVILDIFDDIVGRVQGLVDTLLSPFRGALDGLGQLLFNSWETEQNRLYGKVKTGPKKGNFTYELLGIQVKTRRLGPLEVVEKWWKKFWNQTMKPIEKWWADTFEPTIDRFNESFGRLLDALGGTFGSIWAVVAPAIAGFLAMLGDFALDRVVGAFETLARHAENFVSFIQPGIDALDQLATAMEDVQSQVDEFFSGKITFDELFGNLTGGLGEWLFGKKDKKGNVIDKGVLQTIVDGIEDFLKNPKEGLQHAFEAAASAVDLVAAGATLAVALSAAIWVGNLIWQGAQFVLSVPTRAAHLAIGVAGGILARTFAAAMWVSNLIWNGAKAILAVPAGGALAAATTAGGIIGTAISTAISLGIAGAVAAGLIAGVSEMENELKTRSGPYYDAMSALYAAPGIGELLGGPEALEEQIDGMNRLDKAKRALGHTGDVIETILGDTEVQPYVDIIAKLEQVFTALPPEASKWLEGITLDPAKLVTLDPAVLASKDPLKILTALEEMFPEQEAIDAAIREVRKVNLENLPVITAGPAPGGGGGGGAQGTSDDSIGSGAAAGVGVGAAVGVQPYINPLERIRNVAREAAPALEAVTSGISSQTSAAEYAQEKSAGFLSQLDRYADLTMPSPSPAAQSLDSVGSSAQRAETQVSTSTSGIVTDLASLNKNLYSDGYSTMATYATGLNNAIEAVGTGVRAAFDKVAALMEALLGAASPPRNPKTRGIGKWGYRTMREYADGINRAVSGPVTSSINEANRRLMALQGVSAGTMTTSTSTQRRITLDVNIRDSNGTLNSATAAQIERIFNSDLLASAIEHAAGVV